ncbi:MAG: hypothetical protein WKF31_10090 [Thermoleophilaceae bacterium]
MQVTDTLTKLLDTVLQAIPTIVVFLLILLVGYVVAKVIKGIVAKLLARLGLDRMLHDNQYGQYVEKASPGASPSRLIATVVYFFVLLGALSVAISYTQQPGPDLACSRASTATCRRSWPPSSSSSSPPRSRARSADSCSARWATRAPARSSRPSCR